MRKEGGASTDLETYYFDLWAKNQKRMKRQLEWLAHLKGPLFKDTPHPDFQEEEPCWRCGAMLTPVIFTCPKIVINFYGFPQLCGRCQAGKFHYGYICKAERCKNLQGTPLCYTAEEVWNRRVHFFISQNKPKPKVTANA